MAIKSTITIEDLDNGLIHFTEYTFCNDSDKSTQMKQMLIDVDYVKYIETIEVNKINNNRFVCVCDGVLNLEIELISNNIFNF